MNITDYQQQALDFLSSTNTTISINFLKHGKYFADDEEERDIYAIELKKGNRSFSFTFGQSIVKSGFYYTKGKNKVYINRKHLGAKNLISLIKISDTSFIRRLDKIHYPVEPTAYDILASLQKYDVGTFDNFCSEFGYDTDSRKAEKIYHAVTEEYINICRLFTEAEMEQLQEIN